MASELNAPAWLVAALKEGATVSGYMTAGVEDSVHDMIGRITANAEDDQWDRTIWVRYPDGDTAQADSRFMRELRDQVKAEK
jgi:thioredoxin-like negative regulator of GroEL